MTTSGSTTTTTVYYPGGFAESVNGATSYLASGGLGSPAVALDANGNVEASVLYGPYGSVRYASGSMPTDLGFTGQHSDASTTGLDYYDARYYDPTLGQFTSADTWLAGGLNRYAYVHGNPETRRDPSGHFEIEDPSSGGDLGGGQTGGGGDGGDGGPGGNTNTNSTTNGSDGVVTVGIGADLEAGDVISGPESGEIRLEITDEEQAEFRAQQTAHEGDPNGTTGQGTSANDGSQGGSNGTATSDGSQGNDSNGSSGTSSNPPSPDTLEEGGTSPETGGRNGRNVPPSGPPNSYVTSSGNPPHIWVYDDNGRISWDISAERAKPWQWNTNPAGQTFGRATNQHLPTPEEWLYILLALMESGGDE